MDGEKGTQEFDYSVIEVKHRFNIDRSLDDYKIMRFNKVVRTGYKCVLRHSVDDLDTIYFCILYVGENSKVQYTEFDIRDWTISIVHCTQFTIVF